MIDDLQACLNRLEKNQETIKYTLNIVTRLSKVHLFIDVLFWEGKL